MGSGYQGFCDNSTKALLLKSVKMGGGGVKSYQKLCDVIYGQPPRAGSIYCRQISAKKNVPYTLHPA